MSERPLILLSNDDGYRAQGLCVLREALLEVADVVVCAPDGEQSAASHALSLHRPLRLETHSPREFSVNGTPADCVVVAFQAQGRVLWRKPDLVVSGLNRGVNLGDDVFYSGTVAAAREGALKGVSSLALSADEAADPAAAVELSARLALSVLEAAPEFPLLLNVNFPPGRGWPVRATRLGRRIYTDSVEFRRDPRGREYLWIGGMAVEHRPLTGADTEAFDAGMVGVTPLVLDLWSRQDQSDTETIVERLNKGSDAQLGPASAGPD